MPTTSESESIGAIRWESMPFQSRSMSLSAHRMAYWQHQWAIQTFCWPESCSSEHWCSRVSTFAGTADHASYFNSMWLATFCTKPVKLLCRNGDAPVRRWTKSMVVSIYTTHQFRYIRDHNNKVVSSHVCMEKLFWTEIFFGLFSYRPFPFKLFSQGCYSFQNRVSTMAKRCWSLKQITFIVVLCKQIQWSFVLSVNMTTWSWPLWPGDIVVTVIRI